MTADAGSARHSRQAFIGYATEDKAVARLIAAALRDSGWGVWVDEWELQVGDSIVQRVNTGLASSDVLLLVLSPNSVRSTWMRRELATVLSSELKDRAITVVPALVADCDIPLELADIRYLDLRENVSAGIAVLTSELEAVRTIDFSLLIGSQFETLVSDLLVELGFSTQPTSRSADGGYDLVAVYRSPDPFGGSRSETWLVQTKLYRDQRMSVSVLQQMMGVLLASSIATKGLLVTSGRMTSVARSFLTEIKEKRGHGVELRVIDGADLSELLRQYPALVARYFQQADHVD